MGTEEINKYYTKLWANEIVPGFNYSRAQTYVSNPTNFVQGSSKDNFTGKIYPFGCEGKVYSMNNTSFPDSTLTADVFVIKQEQPGIETYFQYCDSKSRFEKVTTYDQVAKKGQPLVIPGNLIESFRQENTKIFNSKFFLLNTRDDPEASVYKASGTVPTSTSIELAQAVTLNADSLQFAPDGGTQEVKADIKYFSRGGASVPQEHQSWCSLKLVSSGQFNVIVQPNTTGKARQCEIEIYGTDVTDNPTALQKSSAKLKVVQQAGEPQQAMLVEPFRLTLLPELMIQETVTTNGTVTKQVVEKKRPEYNMVLRDGVTNSTSVQGTTLHVGLTSSSTDAEKSFSFDVTNFVSPYNSCKLANFVYKFHKEEETYSTSTKSSTELTFEPINGELRNPMLDPSSAHDIVQMDFTAIEMGTLNKLNITKYTHRSETYKKSKDERVVTEYKLVNDNMNLILFQFEFYPLANTSAARVLETPWKKHAPGQQQLQWNVK